MPKTPLTFNAHDVVANLLRHLLVGYQLDEVVDGVDRRMDTLEALDLLPDGQRIVVARLQMLVMGSRAVCVATAIRAARSTS